MTRVADVASNICPALRRGRRDSRLHMGDDASGVVWHTNETGGEDRDSDDDGASVEMAKPEARASLIHVIAELQDTFMR
jgi:hypothetical protein